MNNRLGETEGEDLTSGTATESLTYVQQVVYTTAVWQSDPAGIGQSSGESWEVEYPLDPEVTVSS